MSKLFYYIKVSGIPSGKKLIKIGPQCVLGVLSLIFFLSVGMLLSNISIWELTCYK